jgi:membrane protein YfhO
VSPEYEHRTQRWRWLPDVGAVGAVAALVVAKCWNLVRPWDRQYRGGDFALSIEPHFYHWLKRGVVLLWDPTIGTGSWLLGGGTHPRFPVISNLHLFYPLNLLWLGLAESQESISYSALLSHHLFHYCLGGAFTYAYARVLRIDRFPAMVSSIAFVFSGFMLAQFNHWTFVDAVVWLPAILACVVRADESGRLRWGALGGAALGVALLAGAPQFAMYNAFAAGGLALVLLGRRVAARRPWGGLALACLLVPVVAFGLAAVQLLPVWTVATGSYRANLGFDWKAQGSLSPSALFQLGLPAAIRPLTTWLDDETFFYPGIMPAILAGFALTFRWDWRVGFHAALGFGSLLLALGDNLPLYRLAFDLVPGVALFRIPARILVLFDFSVAMLAGLGAHRLLVTRELAGLRRVLVWVTALAAASAPAMYLLLLWSANGALESAVAILADQYVILLIVLVLTLAAVAWQARGDAPGLVRAGILAVLVLDLVFGSLSLGGDKAHPERESVRDRELARFLGARPVPYRVNLDDRLDPPTIYRYAISVVDGGSTFAPSRFLDLYFLSEEYPSILDLLNVQYLVRLPKKRAAQADGALRLPPGAVQRIALPSPRAGRRLEVDSYLIGGRDVPGGALVATIHTIDVTGASQAWPIRAGRETAEWTMDRAGGVVGHAKPPVARSWAMPAEAFEGHSYRSSFLLAPGSRVTQLVVEREGTESWLEIEQVRLDGKPLARERSFRRVRPDLYESDDVLPRAFLVRRVRRVAPEQLLEQLKHLDPTEEALVSDALPAGWPTRTPLGRLVPLPPVRIAEYTPHRVRLETTVDEPVLLILSDTYAPGWQALDNGRPVVILRADHALRGVPLGPGSHVVEFRYRQPEFWLGLAISGATALGLAVSGVLARRRPR